MSKHKVVHFEIPASDFTKAKKFYSKAFGWKLEMWEDRYMMANTTEVDENQMPKEAGGINGGFYKRKSKKQQPSIVVETDSIERTLKKVENAGGRVTEKKHPIGEMGFMAEFTDPDGNEIGLWQSAKR